VLKPSDTTPVSTVMMAEIASEFFPPGVFNVVCGDRDTGRALVSHPTPAMVSITGSTRAGSEVATAAAKDLKRTHLELGGKAPVIVFDDADIDDAVSGAVIAKMRNIGEACTSANRFHVADAVADQFAKKLADKLGSMKVGRGTEDGVEVGPLIDDNQRSKVSGLVDDAVGRGAKALVGGHARDGSGYFFDPTVLADVPEDAELLHEEIFGPVAPVKGFDDEDEAVAAANDTQYGLVAYLYTSDLKRALRVCERLETGMVGLNQGMVSNAAAPFGGIKQSGFGREGGPEGIEEYLETKYVAVNL
jgi:succinate-semialdehyde dehydrogenase/glutarate-semialdehyde dehydrogenase